MPPEHRMRLGTKSCVECRRRKKRCILVNRETCRSCLLHSIDCVPQSQPGRRAAVRAPTSTHDLAQHDLEARHSHEDVESLQRLAPCVDVQHVALSPHPQGRGSIGGLVLPSSTGAPVAICPEAAPVTAFLGSALNLQWHKASGPSAESEASHQRLSESIRDLLPEDHSLTSILNATWRYWRLWVPDMPDKGTQKEQVEGAKAMFLESLASSQPAATAKGLFWLTLCMQQLPFEFSYLPVDLRRPREVLINTFLATAGTMLQCVQHAHYEPGIIEAYLLWVKVLINMGHPLEAWQRTRDAGHVALVLGIHRFTRSSPYSKTYNLWTQIWQIDRQLSLVLGLPPFIASSHPSISGDMAAVSVQERLFHRIAQIAGNICDRNEHGKEEARIRTNQLEAELDQLHSKLPWPSQQENERGQTLVELYMQQTCIMLYEIEYIMLLIPYLFASEDSHMQHARHRTLIASRLFLEAYLSLHEHEELFICELMDFQAFLAGLLLIIGALHHFDDTEEHKTLDCRLVVDLIASLSLLSQKMQCNVAGQATYVLKRLQAAVKEEPIIEPFHATIPYFGRVSINVPPRRVNPHTREQETAKASHSTSASKGEFSFDDMLDLELFDFINMDGFTMHDSDELCGDWFSGSACDA